MPRSLTASRPPRDGDDPDRFFRTDHLKTDLGGRSARGGVVTLGAQGFKFVSGTVATIVLARLLTPQDFGLISMVAIVFNFVQIFQYLGLSTATIKWAELNHRQVSTLFWVNLGLSAAFMLFTIGCAPLLAWFYSEPRLVWITIGYAVSILLTGLSIQHEAILSRQMRFAVIAVIEVASIVISFAAAIVAAWYGAGYWALVINRIVMSLVTVVGAWAACRWRPGWPARGTGVRSMIFYGGNLAGFNVTTYLAQNLDNALIGKFWGAYQLGLYSKAYQMLLMPMQQINAPFGAVAVPALSRLADEPERYRAAYLKILEKIAMITMPGVVLMIATSDWLVLFLLGPQWRETGRIFMLLGIAAIIQPVTKTSSWFFSTQGRTRELFRWGVIGAGIAVASIIAGLPWGAVGVAAAYAASDLFVSTPLLFWYMGRRGPVRTGDFYRTIAPALCASVCSLVVLLVCRPWFEGFQRLVTRLSLALVITIAVSLLVLAALPAGRLAMQNFKEMLLPLLKRKRGAAA
ncbi:MAG TPA: lipopolysaccharide biosynthesis protein [Pyrinomonadaceae bacterium]|nr:lipopolysaccharide biosynthesis protein [Pyrinomonadaceae bacterium]